MKKSSKIWKIEHCDIPIYNGLYTECYGHGAVKTQLIYETELDCLLDITTDPENHGLKVYKHQTKKVEEKDLSKSGKFARFNNVCVYLSSKYFSEEAYLNGEVPPDYKLSSYSPEFVEYHASTIYHWVEVFMQ